MLRIVYVALPCTNRDRDGTVTEWTRIYLVATLGVNVRPLRVPSLVVEVGVDQTGGGVGRPYVIR